MWEKLKGPGSESCDVESARLKVPGGWIVRTIASRYEAGVDVSQTFVADVHHDWKLE